MELKSASLCGRTLRFWPGGAFKRKACETPEVEEQFQSDIHALGALAAGIPTATIFSIYSIMTGLLLRNMRAGCHE